MNNTKLFFCVQVFLQEKSQKQVSEDSKKNVPSFPDDKSQDPKKSHNKEEKKKTFKSLWSISCTF